MLPASSIFAASTQGIGFLVGAAVVVTIVCCVFMGLSMAKAELHRYYDQWYED